MRRMSRREVVFAAGENTYGLKVFVEEWRTGSGKAKTYWKYGLPDGVQVFGITEDDKIIAVEEFQPGVGSRYLHLIGETLEEVEQAQGVPGAITAAGRGLREEAGFEADSLEYLSAIAENSSKSDRLIHFVIAHGCRRTGEGEAGIHVRLVEPFELWRSMMAYFMERLPAHGGGNSLKLMALAFDHLGLVTIKGGV